MTYLEEELKRGRTLDEVTPINVVSFAELLEKLKNEPKKNPIPTGIQELDEIIDGFESSRLYVLSAPTKAGKTTLAMTVMYNLAEAGIPSLFFSYEMGWQEVVKKYSEMEEYRQSKVELPLFFPMELYKHSDQLKLQWLFDCIALAIIEKGIHLVVIDHLHFLLPLKDYQNTSFLIGGIVREIKKMAVALKIPIILIAHVGKIKDNKIPDWTDIRDSSFITQEADVVLMLYREINKNAPTKTSDTFTNTPKYSNKTILSVELDRLRGRSDKLVLFHEGSMFRLYNESTDNDMIIKSKQICTHLPT